MLCQHCFRSLPAAVKHGLHLLIQGGYLLLSGVWRNTQGSAPPSGCSGKRFGNHQAIPGIKSPGAFNRKMKANDAAACFLGQQHGSWLGYIDRPAWAIDGKAHRVPLVQFLLHANQCFHSVSGAGPSNGAKPELLDDAGNALAVKAAAGHYGNVSVPIAMRNGNHALMPEAINSQRAGPAIAQAALFHRRLEAKCGTYQADEQVSDPGDEPQQDPLAQGEWARVALMPGRIFYELVLVCAAHISLKPSEFIS